MQFALCTVYSLQTEYRLMRSYRFFSSGNKHVSQTIRMTHYTRRNVLALALRYLVQ